MPVTEITYFKASEAYTSGALSLDEPLALLRKAPGLVGSYVGHQIEQADVVFWVNVWGTQDALDTFIQHPDHARIVQLSRPAFGSEPTVNRVEFDADAQTPLGAPVTELVTFTLHEGASVDELQRRIREVHKAIPGTPQFRGGCWGTIVGKPNVYYGILGWDTVEAHRKAVAVGLLRNLIDEALLISKLWQAHAAFKLV